MPQRHFDDLGYLPSVVSPPPPERKAKAVRPRPWSALSAEQIERIRAELKHDRRLAQNRHDEDWWTRREGD